MKYEAERVNGVLRIKPTIEKKSNGDVTVHVPSLNAIQKFINKEGETKIDGKRIIQ